MKKKMVFWALQGFGEIYREAVVLAVNPGLTPAVRYQSPTIFTHF